MVKMVKIAELIQAIERQQTVINKDALMTDVQTVNGVSDLAQADHDKLAFLANGKYLPDLTKTQAGVVLISQKFADQLPDLPKTAIIMVKDAYLAYASVSGLFAYQSQTDDDIHPTAVISPTATIGKNTTIGAYAVIGDFVQIGDDCQIGSHVSIAHHLSLIHI